MTFGLTKYWKVLNVVPHNVISANQKAESFVYRWLRAHAMLNENVLSRICRSIGSRFKSSVDTLNANTERF